MKASRVYRVRNYAFGRQLLALRTQASLTQAELAHRIGVHRRSIQNWETGDAYPQAEKLQRLIVLYLTYGAFTKGHERAEAHALWSQASGDGAKALAQFDELWFARALATIAAPAPPLAATNPAMPSAPTSPARDPAAQPAIGHTIIDWGEAFAPPVLYGRNEESTLLYQWIVEQRCRAVALLGLGGIGKSSLALTFAQHNASHFEFILFRSLQNGPPLPQVIDQLIGAVAGQAVSLPAQLADKIAQLVQLFREYRCLLILDNLETILQPGTLMGAYRTGYADYGDLLRGLSEREHKSCLLLTSREKPVELGPLAGRTAPVRTLRLAGLPHRACQLVLEAKAIVGTPAEIETLARLYDGNPLALNLVADPIRELFGGDLAAFLATDDVFFTGVGKLLEQQLARLTPLEQQIVYWLAIERDLVPLDVLLARVGESVAQSDVFNALASLSRRMQIERSPARPAFTLQPVILEYVTEQLADRVQLEIMNGKPQLLQRHALVQATTKAYIRRTQERLIATPLLERLVSALGSTKLTEQQLLHLLDRWRGQPLARQGYGPGNVLHLLRLLCGQLKGLNLAHLLLRQADLQSVEMQDANLTDAMLQESIVRESFDALTAVAIDPNGTYWAAASRRGEVLLWSPGGLTLHRMWQAHTDMIWTLAFSPDGSKLASGSWDGRVKLWEIATAALLWSGSHTSHVNSVDFTADGNLLASAGNDATVRIWDVHSGKQLQTLTHPTAVAVIAWRSESPQVAQTETRLLASADDEGCIRIWEMLSRRQATCVQTKTGHTAYVDGLAFAPDGSTLASASWDGTVKLWEVGESAGHGRPPQTLAGHTDRVSRVVWSPDGRTLASSSFDRTIWLWDVEQGRYLFRLQGHNTGVCVMAFAPDGHTLFSGSEDATLRMWEIDSGQCLRVRQGYTATLYDIDWSPDGTQLVSGGPDTLATIWDVTGTTPPQVLGDNRAIAFGVGWSSHGRLLASSEWNNAIRLWDDTSRECLALLQHPNDPDNLFYGLAWSPDGQRLACTTYRWGVVVWDVASGTQQWPTQPFPTSIRHVAWRPDGLQFAGGGDNGILYVWNADGSLSQQLVGHQNMITCVAWSLDGTRLASGGSSNEEGELFVWDPQRGERLITITGHPSTIYALAWGVHPAVVVTSDGNGRLHWWDIQSGTCIRVQQAHVGTIQALRRSPDGSKLASCGIDGTITLWALDSGSHFQTLRLDRPYERMDITGLQGITEAQRASLIALGAVEHSASRLVY